MKLLEAKVAVITGAGSGMAKASAKVFHREGALLVLADVSGAEEATAAEIGGDTLAFHCDVSKEEDVIALMDFAVARFGRLDSVLNVAGLGHGGRIVDVGLDEYDRVMGVNLRGVFLGMKYSIPHMLKNEEGGTIVNWSSTAGIQAPAGTAVYTATKHGVVGLTKIAAAEYGPQGIRVNCICPGFIHSEGMGAMGFKHNPAIVERAALRRGGQPSEVGEVAAFLASERASYVTGAILPVDGGMLVNIR